MTDSRRRSSPYKMMKHCPSCHVKWEAQRIVAACR
ncbi:MAG TPA: hypothetical protein EYN93_03830 [Planctomycetaceae bacterium]|nr:hypothetical protein [Planctomycetaceae bacterium]